MNGVQKLRTLLLVFSPKQAIACLNLAQHKLCQGNIKITTIELTFSIDLIDFLEVLQVSQPAGNKW